MLDMRVLSILILTFMGLTRMMVMKNMVATVVFVV
jgi:hypothetical protein